MYYKYDDYDYWTEHETVSQEEQQKVLEEIANEDFLNEEKKCA